MSHSPSADPATAIEARMRELGLADEPDEAREVLTEFIETLRRRARDLEEAVRSRRREAVVREAHALAGAAVTLGADRLGGLAHGLEEDVAAGRTASLDALWGDVAAEVERVLDACDRLHDRSVATD